jgi:hypothetical protein
MEIEIPKNSKEITIHISITSGHNVDILRLFLAVCTFWAVHRKMANLSTDKAA